MSLRKLVSLSLLLLFCSALVCAQTSQPVQGWCEKGGQTISVLGYNSSTNTPVQRSYPGCGVTVFATGSETVTSGTYTSSGTIVGTTGQSCTLSFLGGTGGVATVTLSATNRIYPNSSLTINTGGTGFVQPPTQAVLSNGTATCSGVANVTALVTGTLATIYSDQLGTPLTNPFTSDTIGHWLFFSTSTVDVMLSGAGLPVPFTILAAVNPAITWPTTYYQTVQANTISQTQRPRLNFGNEFTIVDNSGNTSTDVSINAITEAKITNLVTDLVSKLNVASPTWTGTMTTPITGAVQCLHVSSAGVLSGTGADCGAGGGGGADAAGYYFVGQAANAPVNAINFGTGMTASGLPWLTWTGSAITGVANATGANLNTVFGSQLANLAYMSPNGSAGNPSFRAPLSFDVIFQNAGAHTVAETIDTALKGRVANAIDWGISTSSYDTANLTALNNAIVDLHAAGGGTLGFGPGVFPIAQGVNLLSNVSFYCSPGLDTVFQLSAASLTADWFLAQGATAASNVEFKNCVFDQNNAVSTGTYAELKVVNATNFRAYNNKFINYDMSPIGVVSGSDIVIDHNTMARTIANVTPIGTLNISAGTVGNCAANPTAAGAIATYASGTAFRTTGLLWNNMAISLVYPGPTYAALAVCTVTSPTSMILTTPATAGSGIPFAVQTFHEFVVTASGYGPASNVRITNNYLLNEAMGLDTWHAIVDSNSIWNGGTGTSIVTEVDTPNYCFGNIITNNLLTSLPNPSILLAAGGLENWCMGSIIGHNIAFSNTTVGLDVGGQGSVIDGNVAYNNGTIAAGIYGGINARYGGDTQHNCTSCVFTGNSAFDTAGAGGTQAYGSVVQNNAIYDLTFVGNHFYGAIAPTYRPAGLVSLNEQRPQFTFCQAWTPGTVASQTQATLAFSAPGTQQGSTTSGVSWQLTSTGSGATGGLVMTAYVHATNGLTFVASNNTASGITLGAGTACATVQLPSNYVNTF